MRYKLFAYLDYNKSDYQRKDTGFDYMVYHHEIKVDDHILIGTDIQLVSYLMRNSNVVQAIMAGKRLVDVDVHFAGDNNDQLLFREQLPLFYLKEIHSDFLNQEGNPEFNSMISSWGGSNVPDARV